MTSVHLLAEDGKFLGSPLIIAGKSSTGVVWQPPTLLGVNVTLPFSWRDPVHPTQQALFSDVGISYVRPGMDYLYVNFSTESASHDQAQFYVTGIRRYAADPYQIELITNGLAYALKAGEVMVLSTAIDYTLADGNKITLPAKVNLVCSGGTAGVHTPRPPNGYPVVVTAGTVRIHLGRYIPDNGLQAVSNVKMLHRNFYREGVQIRRPLPMWLLRMEEWLDQGFYFDFGATGPAWEDFELDFGRAAMLHMRRQEWAYFASLNFDPEKVLISDGPEPVDHTGAGDPKQIWDNCQENLAQSYKDIRGYFPEHTVSLGIPNYTAIIAAQYMGRGSWVGDSNSTLRIHGYPRDITGPNASAAGTGSFPLDCDDTTALHNYMNWFMKVAEEAGVPEVYFQELGIKREQPDAQTRYGNYRRELNTQNIKQCLWAASYYFSTPQTYDVAHKLPGQSSGPFVPDLSLTGVFFDD